ncbi:MAG TPA: hypothetical protein VH637_12310 [Streptosporangiaceae bacterium]|jgi:hypothetical protein
MPDRRIGPWSTSGVIGWCTGVATIGGAFAGFIASQTKGSPWHQPVFDGLAAIAAIAFLLLITVGAVALVAWVSPAFRRPARLITSRWQVSTDGVQARAPALAMEIALPGTTYMKQPGDRPPWVRVVVQIGCGQVGEDPDWPAIRAAFTAFLDKSAITRLLADLTHAGQDAAWARQATSTSSIIDMVLGDGMASARLELPDGIRRHGRAEGYALLILHVEPRGTDGEPALPASPSSWRQRFERAVQLPGALAALLSGELGLATSGKPPAQAGIRLEAPRDLTELVDIAGLATLPGAQRLSHFMVYLAASPNGASAVSVADKMTRQMLEEALKVDLATGISLRDQHVS